MRCIWLKGVHSCGCSIAGVCNAKCEDCLGVCRERAHQAPSLLQARGQVAIKGPQQTPGRLTPSSDLIVSSIHDARAAIMSNPDQRPQICLLLQQLSSQPRFSRCLHEFNLRRSLEAGCRLLSSRISEPAVLTAELVASHHIVAKLKTHSAMP